MATAKAADRYRSPRERAVAACTTVAPPPVPPSEPPVLTSLVQPLPVAGTERIGVCCSGGGIRSASFNLGALQALQDEGVLDDAEYLSAVSGGSYIAAAWTMVGRTGHPDDSDADLLREQPPFAPRSPRSATCATGRAYLAPGLVGKVALVWRMLLGLVVNLVSIGLVVVPVGVVVGLFYRSALPVLHTDAAGVEPVGRRAHLVVGRASGAGGLRGAGRGARHHPEREGSMPCNGSAHAGRCGWC
ncbi:hypothetical protein GCM10025868_10150 [Angustibacter aerolatus]|uniref:PNPLA domain-containing protein n=1 Tax=Angustibacter aerolatus TaxID=1162965 RepID=A0ABQ6JG07_9ACTN|nr:patatin-like phospholipase family protein [Angustibacter aerolatus]GMA85765.1 hypothetical protein GCM10025868_10150 [Angustibacter aerolatus]